MNVIGELIDRSGIEQKELVAAVGVSQPTVSDWTRNKKDPKGKNLEKVAKFFGVSTQVVKGYEPIPNPYPARTHVKPGEEFPELQEGTPITPEARSVSGLMDTLPVEQRKYIESLVVVAVSNFPTPQRKDDSND